MHRNDRWDVEPRSATLTCQPAGSRGQHPGPGYRRSKSLFELDGFLQKLKSDSVSVHVVLDDDSVDLTPDSPFLTTGSCQWQTTWSCCAQCAQDTRNERVNSLGVFQSYACLSPMRNVGLPKHFCEPVVGFERGE